MNSTKTSYLALLFKLSGWIFMLWAVFIFCCAIYLFITKYDELTMTTVEYGFFKDYSYVYLFIYTCFLVILAHLVVGGISLFIGNFIQKFWNIEHNIQIIANGYSAPITPTSQKSFKEKPIDALKAAVKPPAKNDDDVKKYGPK
tara:strand:- start:356 stop:787 length:432 start_codon:yes stop_codon:yes gene_type:complete